MEEPLSAPRPDFGRFRGYLRLLAELEMGRGLAPRLDPSDIVQETLLRAHAARDRVADAGDKSRVAWLRTILANTLATAWRDEHREKRDLRREVSLEHSIDASSRQIFAIAADLSSPGAGLRREELMLEATAALAQLPEDQRQVFLLRHWEDCGVGEIAKTMDRTRPAVAGLLRRATAALRADGR